MLRTIPLLLAAAIAVSNAGCFTAIKPAQVSPRSPTAEAGLGLLRVSVMAGELDKAVYVRDLLRDAGVFDEVFVGNAKEADLTIVVSSQTEYIRCGTPQVATVYTLGLLPSTNVYNAEITFEVRGSGSPGPVTIEQVFNAPTRHGLWALFLRVSPKWSKLRRNHDPARLSVLLRDTLLAKELQLLSLVASRPWTDADR